jgi:[protein-PII] uridylyltransferase
VADIRGTSPKVWNAWKAKLLEDLYKVTLRVLGGEPPRPTANCARASRKRWRRCACSAWRRTPTKRCGSSSTWPTSCATTPPTSPGRRAACTTARPRHAGGEVAPGADRRRPAGDGLREGPARPVRAHLQLFRPQELSILDAKIHTTKDGYALDTFLITDENFAGNYRDIINLIEHELCQVLTHQAAAVPRRCAAACRACRALPR